MDTYRPNRFCSCLRCRSRHWLAPALMVTLGVLFLLEEFNVRGASFHHTWPVLLIVMGIIKVLQFNGPAEGHVDPYQPEVPVSSLGGPPPGASGTSGQVDNA